MMENIIYYTAYVISTCMEFYIISQYMKLFLGKRNVGPVILAGAYLLRFLLCTTQYTLFPYALLNSVVGLATIILITFCYGKKLMQRLIAAFLTFMCSFAAEAVVGIFVGIGSAQLQARDQVGNALVLISVKVVFWLICKMIGMFKDISESITLPRTFVATIIGLCALVFWLENMIFMQDNIRTITKALSVISMIVVLYLVIYLYNAISKSYKEKMEAELLVREKSYYYNQAQLLYQSSEELRKLRHDINNHLYALEGMLTNSEEEATVYIQNLIKKIEQTKSYSNTGNLALDSIINYKLSHAGAGGIEITAKIELPKGIHVADDDLVAIIGNALDNAIEAQQYVADHPYICFSMKYKTGAVFIAVENSFDGNIQMDKNRLQTRKKNSKHHGIGTRSIQTTVQKYDGTVEFGQKELRFFTNIMLYEQDEKVSG